MSFADEMMEDNDDDIKLKKGYNVEAEGDIVEMDVVPTYKKYWNEESEYGIFMGVTVTDVKAREKNKFYVDPNAKRVTLLVSNVPEPAIGKLYKTKCKVVHNEQYGLQYKTMTIYRDEPITPSEELSFIKALVTEKQYNEITSVYSNPVTAILDGEFDVKKVKGVGDFTYEKIHDKVMNNFSNLKLIAFLGEFGITATQSRRIALAYESPEMAIQAIRLNPYILYREVVGYGFIKADNVALKMGIGETSPKRISAVIMYMLEDNLALGNTWMKKGSLIENTEEFLEFEVPDYSGFFDKKEFTINEFDGEERVALTYAYECEKDIAEMLKSLHSENKELCTLEQAEKLIKKIEEDTEVLYTDEQKSLIYNVMTYQINVFTANAGCVDKDTEFFTGNEWKKISEYKHGDMVMQYNNGTGELVKPEIYIKNKSEYLWHFKTKYGLDQCLSDNHNVLYETTNKVQKKDKFENIRKKQQEDGNFRGKFLTTFNYSGNGIELSDNEIRLMVATIADGNFCSTAKEDHKSYKRVRFHLKKDRKQTRLIKLINDMNLEYKISKSCVEGYEDIYVVVPRREKIFTKHWYQCDSKQLEVIYNELEYWDGSKGAGNRKYTFSTCEKETADFVQFVQSSQGYRSTIRTENRVGKEYKTNGKIYTRKSIEYDIMHTDRNRCGFSTNADAGDNTEILPYKTLDGYEYCFTVPSGNLILRRNDKVFITGNCGKSFTTNLLIKILDMLNVSYALMSPTAKAAKVIKSYTNRKAMTIHRHLIEAKGDKDQEPGFLKDVVVIDEASMVDIFLFRSVLKCIKKGTKLLMIGDDAQLESISAGNVLSDLKSSNVLKNTTLTKVFRQALDSGILEVATKIREGENFTDGNDIMEIGKNKDLKCWFGERDDTAKRVIKIFKNLIKTNSIDDITVMAPMKNGSAGIHELNHRLQNLYNPYSPDKAQLKYSDDVIYRVGDKVMNIKNLYDLPWRDKDYNITRGSGVLNGDIGIIIDIDIKNNVIFVDFEDMIIIYKKAEFKYLTLAYCSTVHKMQGGGCKIIILALDFSHFIMLKRNLLYTAITRAKEKAYLVGESDAYRKAINNNTLERKRTYLFDLLVK